MDIYTDVRPTRTHIHATKTLVSQLDDLADLGAKVEKLPEVKTVRALHERYIAIAAERAGLGASAESIVRDAGRALADGTATADQVRTAAVSATLAGDGDSTLRRIYDAAARQVEADARAALATLGDRWVVEILRPLVNTRVTLIMDTLEPGRAQSIALDARDPLAHNRHEDGWRWNQPLVNAWAELEELHKIADEWRDACIIPATRRTSDAWRWAEPITLNRNTLTAFIYHQRNGHEAGIFTEAETAERYDAGSATSTDSLPPGNAHEQPGSRLGLARPGRAA